MADDTAQAKESGGQKKPANVKKKISLVKILILLLVLLVAFAGAGLGVWWWLTMGSESADSGGSKDSQSSGTEGDSSSASQGDVQELGTVELQPFVVNLADNSSYLKISIALGYGAVDHEQLLKDKSTQVRDAILTVLSSKSSKTISTKHGKMKLKEDIKSALDKLPNLRNVVTSVYFTDFQIL
ncbi:MAG: flagellar basal body-associated FliL family protein [Candidatus Coatesbacteria bacterium]|nr:flagellar basal body-associated FliL family protein [Candidatus Coatesbacteria bacterium]